MKITVVANNSNKQSHCDLPLVLVPILLRILAGADTGWCRCWLVPILVLMMVPVLAGADTGWFRYWLVPILAGADTGTAAPRAKRSQPITSTNDHPNASGTGPETRDVREGVMPAYPRLNLHLKCIDDDR